MESEFVVALRVLRLTKGSNGGDIGFDLDRFCSCQGDEKSCIPPAGQSETLACDGAEGRDNQTPALFGIVSLALNGKDLSQLYSDGAEAGDWGVVFRVRDYNGEPNDSKVSVAWYGSPGPMAIPTWDGTDAWPILTSTLGPMATVDDPKYFDDYAYVTDGTLVVSVPEGGLFIASQSSRLTIGITSGTITARIEKDALGRYVLRDGVITGRIPERTLFEMVSSFRGEGGKPFCTTELFWNTAKEAFCRGLDIQAGPAEPNKPCNAASFAAGFDADPATLGVPLPPDPASAGCPPESDPLTYYTMNGCNLPP